MCAALLALVLTPVVRWVVLRYEIVDRPEARRVNTIPVPRAGGLAVSAAFLLVAGVFLALNDDTDIVPVPIFLAAIGGRGAAARRRRGGRRSAPSTTCSTSGRAGSSSARSSWPSAPSPLGITIDFIANPLRRRSRSASRARVAAGLTIFWIVGMINSINWIDGLDGLSSGVAFIAAVTLGLISLTTAGRPAAHRGPVLRARRRAARVPALELPPGVDLRRDQRRPVRRATRWPSSPILGTAKVAVALLVLGVPIIDTFWIIVRRVSQGRSPFSPDRTHIHHRLLDLGLSHRQTVLAIYGICLALARPRRCCCPGSTQLYAFLGVFVAFGLVLFLPTRGDFDRPDELEAESYEPEPVVEDARH